jgi:tetratricopeptide (TPR) repeat protein
VISRPRNLLVVSLAKQAELHHIHGEYEQSIELYEEVIEMVPEARDRWLGEMALVRIDMGQAEEGLDMLRAQAIAHPGDSAPWLTIGVEAEALGRLEEAEENLQRASRTASDPDDKARAYLALFDLYREQGRVDEALAAWDQAWEGDGQESGYVFPLYQMMWEAGDLERSREYLSQEKNPLRKGFHQGLLAITEGNTDEATKQWTRVAKLNPLEYDEGHDAWAESALRVDHPPEEVIGVLSSVLEAGNFTPRGLLLQGIAEARIGHLEHAQEVLEVARNIGMRTRPREEKLPEAHWTLFDELVEDDEIKDQLQHLFETEPESKVEVSQE